MQICKRKTNVIKYTSSVKFIRYKILFKLLVKSNDKNFRKGNDDMSKLRQKLNYCPVCGKLYAVNAAKMCERCLQKEDEKIILAAEYLESHPNATLAEVMEVTKIHKNTIIRMAKSGMLGEEFEDSITHPCRRCGAPITRGDFCPRCAAMLSGTLNELQGRVQANIDAADPEAAEQRRKNKEANEEYIKKLEIWERRKNPQKARAAKNSQRQAWRISKNWRLRL